MPVGGTSPPQPISGSRAAGLPRSYSPPLRVSRRVRALHRPRMGHTEVDARNRHVFGIPEQLKPVASVLIGRVVSAAFRAAPIEWRLACELAAYTGMAGCLKSRMELSTCNWWIPLGEVFASGNPGAFRQYPRPIRDSGADFGYRKPALPCGRVRLSGQIRRLGPSASCAAALPVSGNLPACRCGTAGSACHSHGACDRCSPA